jgi:hypothetical protein
LSAEDDSFYVATQAAELAQVLFELGAADEAVTWLARAERSLQEDDLTGRIAIGIARVCIHGDDAAQVVALAGQTDNLNVQAEAHLAAGDAAAAQALYLAKGNAAAARAAAAS